MARLGVIQHENVLRKVLGSGNPCFIVCNDRKDAHSKAVSLNNARSRLTIAEQKKLKVQKTEIDGVWGVRISPASEAVIWEIVDGKMVRWDPDEGKLSDDDQRMFDLMVKDKVPLEDILGNLPKEKESIVRDLYKQIELSGADR
jgi:hypothetical protein